MIKQETIKIYVSTVKKINKNLPSGYEIMQAGSEINYLISSYTRDNIGENISYKNKSYCELTVLYWMWKNSHNDILGLSHHRRFFFNQNLIPQILNINEIRNILKKKEIIIPKPSFLGLEIEPQYKSAHVKEDYDLCREIIKEDYKEFLEAFDINGKQKTLHSYNMLITRKEILDDYCSFLFPLLEKIETQIDISKRDTYQQRVFGFLAERLFQVWLIKYESLEKQECPVYKTDRPIMLQKLKRYLENNN